MPIVTTPHGVSINYEETGDPAAPVMLLVQGLSAQLLGWRPELCEQLASRGYRVVRFDNRDVGLSQKFPEGGYGIGDMADDAVGLLDALGVPAAHVVGQSMGGMVAQHLATDYPERVLSLALLYTAPSTAYLIGADQIHERLDTPLHPTRDEATAAYVHNEAACRSTAYPQDTTWLAELGGQMFDRCYDPAGVERQMLAVLSAEDRTALASSISAPTTIVHGTDDLLISPEASRVLHSLIPRSTLDVHHGMGHELPRELWPEIVARITDNADVVARQPT